MFSSPSWSFLHFFIHSYIYPSLVPPIYTPFFHPSVHPSIHTSSPGSLRQEVLQLQLSAKASLKGNSSDPRLPDLSFVSDSRLVQKLSKLAAVHAVNPPVSLVLNSPRCFSSSTEKI